MTAGLVTWPKIELSSFIYCGHTFLHIFSVQPSSTCQTTYVTWMHFLLETTYHIYMKSQHSRSMTCVHTYKSSIQRLVVMRHSHIVWTYLQTYSSQSCVWLDFLLNIYLSLFPFIPFSLPLSSSLISSFHFTQMPASLPRIYSRPPHM